MVIYHGTAAIFEPDIRDGGLPALPAEAVDAGAEVRRSLGIRVRLKRSEALRDARAWTAWAIVEHMKPPVGIIVKANVVSSRIYTPQGETLRVRRLDPSEIEIEKVQFPEFGGIIVGGRRSTSVADARMAIEKALEEFEQITDRRVNVPFPKRRRG